MIDKDLKKKNWLKITVTINLTSALFTDIFYHYDYTFFTLELLRKLRKFNILNHRFLIIALQKKERKKLSKLIKQCYESMQFSP